jgi:hypothetical protein
MKIAMKRIPARGLAALLSFILITGSCKKGDDNSGTSLLTRAEWKFQKSEQRINSEPFDDVYPSWPACNQDDRYVFAKNGTYSFTEGPTKCNASSPDVIATGTWGFTGLSSIVIDGIESVVEQLDETTFIISRSYISNPDTNYFRFTFVHP